ARDRHRWPRSADRGRIALYPAYRREPDARRTSPHLGTDPVNRVVEREPFTNYFNYFTEIEEHFQRARGTSLFLLSPLDWALLESWKNSGVPLEAVLRGIDLAFEKWRVRRSRVQMVNSIAYCTQAVMMEAQRMADSGQQRPQHHPVKAAESAPFPLDD